MMNFFQNHFLLFIVDSLDYRGKRPRHALLFATVPIISFIIRTDSTFSRIIFAYHVLPVVTEGWTFFTSGSQKSRSIRKSYVLPNLNFSTSENIGNFSICDVLYSATFVQDFPTPNQFFLYLVINRSTVSTFPIDTSYTFIGHHYLGNNPKEIHQNFTFVKVTFINGA